MKPVRWRWPVWAAAGTLALALAAGVAVLRRSSRHAPDAASAPRSVAIDPSRGHAGKAVAMGVGPGGGRLRRTRIPIPRLTPVPPPSVSDPSSRPPAATSGPNAAAGDPSRRAPRGLEGGRAHLYDRRPEPGPDAEALRSRLRDRLRAVDDAVEDCLALHSEADPSLAAGVLLAFTLDARGLQEVWIEDHEPVADGPLACLSQAVYGVGWAGLTTEPLELSRRMRSRRDTTAGDARRRARNPKYQ